jgi:hypothetical protein
MVYIHIMLIVSCPNPPPKKIPSKGIGGIGEACRVPKWPGGYNFLRRLAMEERKKEIALRNVPARDIILRAYRIYLKTRKRTVVVHLLPEELPPEGGEYDTSLGVFKLSPFLDQGQGRWKVRVRFPAEGFTIGELVKKPS